MVIGFTTLSIPPPGRGFPASLLNAKTVSIFHAVSLKSYQISGCRRWIISAALWRMHCWGCPVTQREKGKSFPLCLSIHVRLICHPLLPSCPSRLGTATLLKGLLYALIKTETQFDGRIQLLYIFRRGIPCANKLWLFPLYITEVILHWDQIVVIEQSSHSATW